MCIRDRDEARLDAIQSEYDARCEAARESKLAPERALIVQECLASRASISSEHRTEAWCNNFAASHGDATVRRGPLYYELEACQDAFKLKNLNRNKRNRR